MTAGAGPRATLTRDSGLIVTTNRQRGSKRGLDAADVPRVRRRGESFRGVGRERGPVEIEGLREPLGVGGERLAVDVGDDGGRVGEGDRRGKGEREEGTHDGAPGEWGRVYRGHDSRGYVFLLTTHRSGLLTHIQ